MSSFYRTTKHPITGEFEEAKWVEATKREYMVTFPSGGIFSSAMYQWEFRDEE